MQGEPLLVSIEDKGEELGIGDFRASTDEQWVTLVGKACPDGIQIKLVVQFLTPDSPALRKSSIKTLDHSSDCPRCSYLEKISESQQNELLSLEEHKSTYYDIKQIIKEYYSVDHIPYATKYIPDIEELGIELPAPYHGKSSQISKQEAEHLKEVLVGLTEKLKNLQSVQEEVKVLRQQLYESHVNRLNLQGKIKETTDELENKCKEKCKKHLEINEERSKATQALLDQQHLFSQKSLELDQLNSDLSTLNATLQQLKAEEFNFNTMKEHVSRLETELKESRSKRDELKNDHAKALVDFSKAKNNQKENSSRLAKEKQDLQVCIEDLNKQLLSQKNINNELLKTTENLDLDIKALEEEIASLGSENKEIELSRQVASEKEDACIKLHKEIHDAAKKFESELENLSNINTQLLNEKIGVVDQLNKLENVLENKTEEIQDLTRNNYSSLAQVTILEQQVCIQNDQDEIRKAIEAQTEMNEKIKEILLAELAQMGEYLQKQSEECLGLSKTVEQCKQVLDEKNQEKNEIQKIVEDLKVIRPVYISVRGDTVDKILGEVLNSREDWKSVDMKRLDEGCYRFGTKEIGMFIQENMLMVRLGKAIMDIDEFLKTYTPLEMHKKQFNPHQELPKFGK